MTFDHNPITPSESVRFLSILVDNRLTFIVNVENLNTDRRVKHAEKAVKCDSISFLMRQLRKVGMNQDGLKAFYCTSIHFILAYASPVFCNFLSNTCKWRLERVQASATKIIEPDLEYIERLKVLDLQTLSDFINTASESVFKNIAGNENIHLLIILSSIKQGSPLA